MTAFKAVNEQPEDDTGPSSCWTCHGPISCIKLSISLV